MYWFLALTVWISLAAAGGQNFSPSDAKAVLKLHNEYRRVESAADMYRLYWNISLQQRADSWAQKCQFKHERNLDLGENLYFDTDHENEVYLRGMKAWHDEKSSWSHSNKACLGTCHFTQIIWAYTTTVGCSANLCPSLNVAGRTVDNALLFVCYYYPRGNFISLYPYAHGKPCSKCATDDTCTENLCVSSGPESKLAPAFVKSLNPLSPLHLKSDVSYLEAFRSLSHEFSSQSHRVSQQSLHSYSSQTYQHNVSSSSYTQTSGTAENGLKTESHHITLSHLKQENAIHREHQWIHQAKGQTVGVGRVRHEDGPPKTGAKNPRQAFIQSREEVARREEELSHLSSGQGQKQEISVSTSEKWINQAKGQTMTFGRVRHEERPPKKGAENPRQAFIQSREEEARRDEELRHLLSSQGQKQENSVSTSAKSAAGMRHQDTSPREFRSDRHHSATSLSEIKKAYRPPPEDRGVKVTTTPRAAEIKRYEYEAPEHNEILQRNGATCADRHPECIRWATKCYRSAMVTLTCPLTCSKCAKNLTNIKAEQLLKSSYHKSRKRNNPKIYHKQMKSRKSQKNESREQRLNGQRHGERPFRDQPVPDRVPAQPVTTTEFWEHPQGAAAPMELRYSAAEGRYNPQISRPHAEETATSGTPARRLSRRRKQHTQARDGMCRDDPQHIISCKYWSKKGFCQANQLIKTLYCRWSCASCG